MTGPETSTVREDPIRRLFALLAQHPALGLTSAYLLVSLLGLSYEWTLFRRFGVNFFHYADVTDFLMGAFREPITFVLALSAVLVGKLAQLQVDWEARRFAGREFRSWWMRKYASFSKSDFNRLSPILYFLLYVVMFIWVYSDFRADQIREGHGRSVQVMLIDAAPAREAFSTLLLGTSSRFVFLYDSDADLTWIVPNENLAWIRVATPAVPP